MSQSHQLIYLNNYILSIGTLHSFASNILTASTFTIGRPAVYLQLLLLHYNFFNKKAKSWPLYQNLMKSLPLLYLLLAYISITIILCITIFTGKKTKNWLIFHNLLVYLMFSIIYQASSKLL